MEKLSQTEECSGTFRPRNCSHCSGVFRIVVRSNWTGRWPSCWGDGNMSEIRSLVDVAILSKRRQRRACCLKAPFNIFNSNFKRPKMDPIWSNMIQGSIRSTSGWHEYVWMCMNASVAGIMLGYLQFNHKLPLFTSTGTKSWCQRIVRPSIKKYEDVVCEWPKSLTSCLWSHLISPFFPFQLWLILLIFLSHHCNCDSSELQAGRARFQDPVV
jgi:hypothetical protein